MQTPAEYLQKTESAVRRLFDGIESYTEILRQNPTPAFVADQTTDADFNDQLESWEQENRGAIEASLKAQHEYLAESFARSTLCGAVLQVAAKALECHSQNDIVPAEWSSVIRPGEKVVRFCIGRQVRGVPLGLIIYAGRNQHIHFEDQDLREPNRTVFEWLATKHGYSSTRQFRDPAFDLQNEQVVSFASNVMDFIGWQTYDAYFDDLRALVLGADPLTGQT